jgi:3-phenylpropionate/trans-cinnamate dioxygenase ferredoxin component
MTWVHAADASLPDETVTGATIGGTLVALARVEGAWHAVEAWCTHAECPLTDGWVEGSGIRCACHGSLFDLLTGEPLEGPADEPVRTFATRVVLDRVEVELP